MTKYKNVDSKLSRTGMKYDHKQEVAKPEAAPAPVARPAPVAQQPSSNPLAQLISQGPPVEAANVMRYDASTNENIYAHVAPVENAPAARPIRKKEKEVRLVDENVPANIPRKTAVPRETGKIAPRTQKNFLKQNSKAVVGKGKHPDNKPEPKQKHKSYGKVPKYMQKIN